MQATSEQATPPHLEHFSLFLGTEGPEDSLVVLLLPQAVKGAARPAGAASTPSSAATQARPAH